jgi:hypothetical protein
MHKYGVAPAACRTYNGMLFDSKAEMHRYIVLLHMERAGEITNLERQTEYVLIPGFTSAEFGKMRAIKYRADFRYFETSTGKTIVEDVKGMETPVYKIKRTLLLWRYPEVHLVEVKAV